MLLVFIACVIIYLITITTYWRLRRYRIAYLRRGKTEMVEPQEVVDKGPKRRGKQASIGLSCIYEKKRYEHSPKDGCLRTILPEQGVYVKRANRAGKYCRSWQQKDEIQMQNMWKDV
jgi:hypothetical protein